MEFEKKHDDMIRRIYAEVVGDEYHENGIIKRVENNEKQIRKHSNNFYIMYSVISICILIFTFYDKLKVLFS